MKVHPQYTNYRHYFKETLDYIFYTPKNTKVNKILDIPNIKSNLQPGEQDDMPSAIFPSDHFRVSAEFEIFY
jgi:mRNA deadenylase 3'-5' endonuclease subunit Ccr4